MKDDKLKANNLGEPLTVEVCKDTEIIKEIFREYSQIKGAESCFKSFDREIADLNSFYEGGAMLLGSCNGVPVASIAIRRIDENACEAKRLYIKPAYRGRGYARVMLNAMLDKAKELGFKEVRFTTKPDVMQIGYELYKRMGFQENGEQDGIVEMRMPCDKKPGSYGLREHCEKRL